MKATDKATEEKTSIKGVILREVALEEDKNECGDVHPSTKEDVYLDKSESKDKWHTVSQAQPDEDGDFVFEEVEVGKSYRVRLERNGVTICSAVLENVGLKADAVNRVTLKIPRNVSCADATKTKDCTSATDETLKKTDTADKCCAADKDADADADATTCATGKKA